jgi:hypothetical protein
MPLAMSLINRNNLSIAVWFAKVRPVFERPYLKKNPMNSTVIQYLGFTPMNHMESPISSLNSKYWNTSNSHY